MKKVKSLREIYSSTMCIAVAGLLLDIHLYITIDLPSTVPVRVYCQETSRGPTAVLCRRTVFSTVLGCLLYLQSLKTGLTNVRKRH